MYILTMVLVSWAYEIPIQVTASTTSSYEVCVKAHKAIIKGLEEDRNASVYRKIDQTEPYGDITYMTDGKKFNAIISCTQNLD